MRTEIKSHTNSIGMEFVLIPAGTFLMGSPDDEERANEDEKPQHEVRISRPFHLGVCPVTQAQWEAVMGNNPSAIKKPDHPVEMVSWADAQEFIMKLNVKEGHNRHRLPTEAEWEYACRAGTKSLYFFGDDPKELTKYAWYGDNPSGSPFPEGATFPVRKKKPNPWGLYDMYGNVSEWVQDWYAPDYYQAGFVDDPQGPPTGVKRVLRGGGWNTGAGLCRSATRNWGTPDNRSRSVGFRLVKTVE